MAMRKMFVIAAREYNAAVRTKAFVIGLLLMPLLMGGSIIMQMLFKDVRDLKPKEFVFVDRTPGQSVRKHLEKEIGNYNEELNDAESGKQVRPLFKLREEPEEK